MFFEISPINMYFSISKIETMIQEKLQKIYESSNSTIYKGLYKDFDDEVIVKVLNADSPDKKQIAQFNNEYNFIHNLEIPGVRKALKKTETAGEYILILEYFEGKTLTEFISKNSIN